MFKTLLLTAMALASVSLMGACDQRDYRPNADPLGLEDSDTMSDSTDLPELPTLSDAEAEQTLEERQPPDVD